MLATVTRPLVSTVAKEDTKMNTNQCDIGLIGLAVMGENLALNLESKGFPVAVFNRTTEVTEKFAAGRASGKNIQPTRTLEEFVAALKKDGESPISDYGARTTAESYAECFMVFVADPELLKALRPKVSAYFTALFAPPALREDLFTLYAFNVRTILWLTLLLSKYSAFTMRSWSNGRRDCA